MQGVGKGLSINISFQSKNGSFISADLIKLLIREGSTPPPVTKGTVNGRFCQSDFSCHLQCFRRQNPGDPGIKDVDLTSATHTHAQVHSPSELDTLGSIAREALNISVIGTEG